MNADQPTPPIPQANPFQRFTIRLVDGRFVRVPKPDLPSVEPCVDPSATSNQTAIRDLFQLVNGQFVRVGRASASDVAPFTAKPPPGALTTAPAYPDPTFALPDERRPTETR